MLDLSGAYGLQVPDTEWFPLEGTEYVRFAPDSHETVPFE